MSIRWIGTSTFYDVSVPGPEHYFAEGAIHHNSAKTYNVVSWGISWWMMAPSISSLILCSTTVKSLRKRAWAEVSRYHSKYFDDFGNFVDSQTIWRYQPGDDKHAIFGMAVQEGSLTKVADNIKGIHTIRQMIIIDEATAVPGAIWDAATNLYGFPIDSGGEFIMVALGNARSRLDQFGRYIEPDKGWDSVSKETDEWDGKPRPEDNNRVKVIRFDFRKSPNITMGKRVSKYLPTEQRVRMRLKALADRGAENDPTHWSNDLGFPPPEGLTPTVFSETMLQKHGAYDRHEFTGNNFKIIGAFDQSRGGDRPALRFAAMGEIKGGGLGVESMPAIILALDSTSKEPIAYQYLAQIRKWCDKVPYRGGEYKCPPENLGVDCTNEAATVDIFQKEWSEKIIRVLFSGACSEEPCSHEDERPANEVYHNKRAEMAFRTKSSIESGQWKGIDKDTAAEMVAVEFTGLRKDGTSRKLLLMDKEEYKLKWGASPDLFDSEIILREVARIRGFSTQATGTTAKLQDKEDDLVKQAQAVYDSDISTTEENLEPWEFHNF